MLGGERSSTDGEDPYRCPNCGARLEFSANQSGGYCPIEDIRIDVAKPDELPAGGPLADVRDTGDEEEEPDDIEEDLDTLLAGVADDDRPEEQSPDIDTFLSELDAEGDPGPAPDTDDPPEPLSRPFSGERAYASDDPDGPPPVPRVSAKRLRRDRFAFYLGTILMSIGGIGLVLGSLLHDALRVPWFGTAFGTFGPLNATGAGLGLFVLLLGLVALWRGLRGGVLPADAVSGG